MKIRIDENVSKRVAYAVLAIVANRPGYEVSYVRQEHQEGTDDPDWLRAFAAKDGTAIVSGDHRILLHWPNLVAYKQTGLISFFPPAEYERLSGFARAAFWIRWWPEIVEKIKVSERGDRWRLPYKWLNIHHSNLELLRDPRVDDAKAEEDKKPTAKVHRLSPPNRGGRG